MPRHKMNWEASLVTLGVLTYAFICGLLMVAADETDSAVAGAIAAILIVAGICLAVGRMAA